MKSLSEFLEVGEGCVFRVNNKSLTYMVSQNMLLFKTGNKWMESFMEIKTIIENGITITKQFTDDEKVIARCMPKEYKWIARDDNNRIWAYVEKPYRDMGGTVWKGSSAEPFNFDHLFESIKSTDTEPTLIEDIYK